MVAENFCSLSPISVAIAAATVLITMAYYFLKNRNLPPGPVGLPYLGYWPFLRDRTCGKQLAKLKKKYGDVFSFTCTGRLFINLGTVKAIREAHISKSDCFGGRYTDFSVLTGTLGKGVGFVNGEAWRVTRKFFMQVLRDRGLLSIKESSSGPMYESAMAAVEELSTKKGEAVNLVELLTDKCSSIMRKTLFGEIGITDARVRQINELYGSVMTIMTPTLMLPVGNIARYGIFPLLPSYWHAMKSQKKLQTILYQIIDEHKSTYDAENPRDVIDDFFKERDVRRSKGDPTAAHFNDTLLMSSLEQIVGDGVLSVAGFICVVLKAFLEHPDLQQKVYDEIIEVIGTDRQTTVEDKNKLPYTNAFILESLRTSEFFPIFPSLECSQETELRGYRIPKGAITLINLHTSNFDPEEFEDPQKFNPSRYIPKEGKKRPELPIVFGMGKRACIGEGFVMMQVFLFLTTIIQKLELSVPEAMKVVLLDEFLKGQMKVIAQPRN